ncbi:hypothetical protein ACFX2J_043998 [Malus domestica]
MECSGVLHLFVLGLLFADLPTLSYEGESLSTCLAFYEYGGAVRVRNFRRGCFLADEHTAPLEVDAG